HNDCCAVSCFSHHSPYSLSLSPLFLHHPPSTQIYTLSLHDALPIYRPGLRYPAHHVRRSASELPVAGQRIPVRRCSGPPLQRRTDRKSTRLNSSHVSISYAVFCLKKKRRYHKK